MSVFIDQDISLNKYHYVFYSYSKENPNSLKAQFYDSNQTIVGTHDISFSQLDVPAMLSFLENSESNPYAIGKTPSSFRNMDVAFSAIYKKPLQDSQQQSLMTYVNKKFKNVYSNAVTVYTVTVANNGTSNVYYINGEEKPDIQLTQNGLYVFDQSDSTNEMHPLRFQLHSNSTPYTIGVTIERTQGKLNAYVMIEITDDTPILNYYCTNHSGMGNVFSKGITYMNELILSSEEQKIGNGGTATSTLTASSWDGRFPASNFISTMSNYFWHTGFTNQLGVTYSTNGNGAWSQTAYGVNAYTSASFRGPNVTYMCHGSLYPDNLISNVTLADGSSPTSLVTRYSDATTYNTTTESGLNGEWVSFDHNQTPFVASEIGWISNALDRNFKTWYFIGSNDNLNWTEIDSRINDTTITTNSLTFTLPLSTTSYKYHTLVITQLNGSSNPVINAYNFYIKGKTVTTNQIEYDGPLTKFQVSVSGESFYIDNIKNSILDLQPGNVYRFSQHDDSNANYPIKFSTTSDGTHNGGTEYTTGIYTTGTPGNFNAHTVIDFSNNPYVDLYYYSDTSSNMGGLAFTPPTYTVKTETNVLGDTVFSIQKPGESVFYAQPDLSFGAGFIGLFNVSQIDGSYTMVFGTKVDVSNTIQTQYFNQTGDVIVLSIPSDYSGDSLKYFENTTAGMGYITSGQIEYINVSSTSVLGGFLNESTPSSTTSFSLNVSDATIPQQNGLYELDASDRSNIYGKYLFLTMFNGQTTYDSDPIGYDFYTNTVFSNDGFFNGITSTIVDSTTYNGVWIQLKMPYEMIITSIDIGCISGRRDQSPAKIVLVGSNDGGNTFEYIYHNTSDYLNSSESFQELLNIPVPGITKAYSTFRMIIQKIGVPGSHSVVVAIDYWNLNGLINSSLFSEYDVTVSGDPAVFYIDGSANPQLTFTPGESYIFDQSDTTNAGNTFVLGTVSDSSTNLIDYQTIVGTPGQPGAYTSFTASGETVYYYSFENPDMGYEPTINAEVLIVGGGGQGAPDDNNTATHAGGGGGGGAGGMISTSITGPTTGYSVNITVGAGGTGWAGIGTDGINGGDSVFDTLTAVGGGGGGYSHTTTQAPSGGSGGGGGMTLQLNTPGEKGGNGISGQGYSGGSGIRPYGWAYKWRQGSGGGGGAGGAGGNGGLNNAGDGGPALQWHVDLQYYAAGGGGGCYNSTTSTHSYDIGLGGDGGYGGGVMLGGQGRKGTVPNQTFGTSGVANTGSGGGSGWDTAAATQTGGADGVVKVWLPSSYTYDSSHVSGTLVGSSSSLTYNSIAGTLVTFTSGSGTWSPVF